MAELTFSSGFDAWVLLAHPGANRSGGDAVRLQSGQRKGILKIPVSGIRGKTVVSATLYGHVKSGWVAQTLTAKMLAAGVDPSTITWDDLPGTVAGITCSVATGALAAGATIAMDTTAIAQAIAGGAKWHGFLLTTNAAAVNTANLRSFTSGLDSWVWVIEISDAPDKPTNPRPIDGAVSHAAPTVAWDGGTTEWVAIQVQADVAADGVSPDFDSGTVISSDSQLDLSTTAFTPLASGASTQWRARAQNADGAWGPWMDWAPFSYTPKVALVMDSPTGGVIGDPTFSVLAHLASGTLRQYRIRVAKGDDRTDIVYDSGHQPPDGGTIARDIPWRDPDTRRRIVKGADTDWQLNVRAWDAVDRAEAVGDPTYVETWVSLTFDDDVNEPPASYTVTPTVDGSPVFIHSWTRSEAADAWLVMDGSEVLAHLTMDDVSVDAGVYSWNDGGILKPWRTAHLKVRAVDAGSRSVASNVVTITSKPKGVWLIPDDGSAPIMFTGDGVDGFIMDDRRDTNKPLNVDTDVDLIYGYEGISGPFTGKIDNRNPTSPGTAGVLAAVDALKALRKNPAARPRFIFGTESIPIQVKKLAPLPSQEFLVTNLDHNVSFVFVQDGD